MKEFNRRDFIKSSSIMAGISLTGTTSIPSVLSGVDDHIKIGLIGCGGRGTGAVVNAFESGQRVKLVAMADAFQENIKTSYDNLLKKYGDKIDVPDSRKYVGFEAYKSAIQDADMVILTTPPGFRPLHFEEVVRQGKHAFLEKPVAVDIPGVRRVLEAAKMAKQKKLNVVVGFQRRFQNNYKEAVKRIHDGLIGNVVAGQVYWNSGGVWVRPRKPHQTEMEYQMRNWYYFNWLCGDHIVEQHVHQLDVANWIKQKYPVSIQGTGSRAHRTGKEYGEIYDNFAIELTYDDGSVIYSQCRHFEGIHNRVDETFQATRGRAYISAGNQAILWDDKGNEIFRHNAKGDPNPYAQEHVELFDAIAKGEYRFQDIEFSAYSTLTGIIGRLACYTGKVINWDQALKSNIDLSPEVYAWTANPKVLPDENGFYRVAKPGIVTEPFI